MVIYTVPAQRPSGRLSGKVPSASTSPPKLRSGDREPLAGGIHRRRSVTVAPSARRAAAGALTTLLAPPAASVPLDGPDLVTGTPPKKAQLGATSNATTAAVASPVESPPVPPPRPPRRFGTGVVAGFVAKAFGTATAASSAAGAIATTTAIVPQAALIARSGPIQEIADLSSPTAIKKSSLATRTVGGGKATDANLAKRRVKFSANVHTYPSGTSTKKSTRIGELQLKKRVKKLKRIHTRGEGGGQVLSGALGNQTSAIVSPSPIANNIVPDKTRAGIIVDVIDPLKTPRVLRLNVVGKGGKPLSGKASLGPRIKAKKSGSHTNLLVTQHSTSLTVEPKARKTLKAKKIKKSASKISEASSSQLVPTSTSKITIRKKIAPKAASKKSATLVSASNLAHGRRSQKV